MREICKSASMSGVWKRSHGRTTEAPPNERGGKQICSTYRHRATLRLYPSPSRRNAILCRCGPDAWEIAGSHPFYNVWAVALDLKAGANPVLQISPKASRSAAIPEPGAPRTSRGTAAATRRYPRLFQLGRTAAQFRHRREVGIGAPNARVTLMSASPCSSDSSCRFASCR